MSGSILGLGAGAAMTPGAETTSGAAENAATMRDAEYFI
jgi:hypothetical protein